MTCPCYDDKYCTEGEGAANLGASYGRVSCRLQPSGNY